MKAVHGTILGLAITVGSLACNAQGYTIPSEPIDRDGKLAATLPVLDNETARSLFSSRLPTGVVPAVPSATGFVRVTSVSAPRTLDSRYYLINGLHLAMALLDVGISQRCIATNQYKEGNPLMPSSLGAQLGVDFALVSYGSFVSYRMKKQGSSAWWVTPIIGVGTHSVGVAVGFNVLAHQ